MKRTAYFDFLRGIAILMVVGIHTFATLPFIGGFNIFAILIRQIIGCAVPVFLALSGFLLGSKNITSFEQKISFWGKQISKVYIPALLWSIPLFVLSLAEGDSGIVKAVAKFFLMGFSIYYFIALIIQCYLALPLLQKIDYTVWGGGNMLYINNMRSSNSLVRWQSIVVGCLCWSLRDMDSVFLSGNSIRSEST